MELKEREGADCRCRDNRFSLGGSAGSGAGEFLHPAAPFLRGLSGDQRAPPQLDYVRADISLAQLVKQRPADRIVPAELRDGHH